ncbi:MAG: polysaccharide deacetylase family protein [Butyribacter sp.]|nr:polysaccharide deacetylase family protein [bacterium]MDY3854015.1 polysaccharide deacetylase family protein [Butyribacter sp.]
MKKILKLFILFFSIEMLFCCSGSKTSAATKVTVTRKEATAPVRVGTDFALRAKVTGTKEKPIRWVSRNEKYAIVSKKGIVRAKRAGIGKTVRIVAACGNAKGGITLTILPKINPKKKMIALTYDDGPRYSSTRKILRALKQEKAVATFFTVGSNTASAKNRKILKQSFDYGNEIANHTQSHKNLTRITSAEVRREIRTTDRRLQKLLGVKPTLFRPPYGAMSAVTRKISAKPNIMWSVDTLDWKTRNANSTYRCIMRNAKDGSIVLMHDIHDATANAALRMLKGLKKKGYQFVTVDELYRYKRKKLHVAGSYFCVK